MLLSLLLLAVAVAAALTGSEAVERTASEMFIRMVLVIGLYIFVGNSGVMSFGHVGFMCIGAYASAWQTLPVAMKQLVLPGLPQWLLDSSISPLPAAIFSALLVAVVALISGLVLMRLSGIAASIATFAFLAVVNVVYSNWDSVSAGTSSVVGIPVYANLWVTIAWAIVAIAIAFFYSVSRYGLALRAVREDPVAAQACGVWVYRERLVAYVLSAFVVGLAGVLYAHFLGVLNPDAFYLDNTFLALAMLVVGGVSSLSGAVVGVLSLSLLIELLVRMEDGVRFGETMLSLPGGAQEVLLGVAMILMLIFRPGGLMAGREIVWRKLF